MSTPDRTTKRRSVLALAVFALALAACSSSTPTASKRFVPIPGVNSSPPPTLAATAPPSPRCASKPATQVVDTEKFHNWDATCTGQSALATYRSFIAAFNQVWSNPFQNGLDVSQEQALLARSSVADPSSSLPPGCVLPPDHGSEPISLPPACAPLVSGSASSQPSPLAAETAVLDAVATPQVVSEVATLQGAAMSRASMPTGSLVGISAPVVREASPTGRIDGIAPSSVMAPELPHFAPAWLTVAPGPTEVVWACLADHLAAKGPHGVVPTTWAPVYGPNAGLDYGPAWPTWPVILGISDGEVVFLSMASYNKGETACSPAF